MGWQLPEKYRNTYLLVFADPDFHGLEVRVRRVSFDALRTAASLSEVDVEKARAGQMSGFDLEKIDRLIEQFAAALIGWNLEDEQGQPVPATLEALRGQDIALVLELVDAWMHAVSQSEMPTRPEPVDEAELPMETLAQ